MAASKRRCGGGPQTKVGHLRARHGKGVDTHGFKAARQRAVVRFLRVRLTVVAQRCHSRHDLRWHGRRRSSTLPPDNFPRAPLTSLLPFLFFPGY